MSGGDGGLMKVRMLDSEVHLFKDNECQADLCVGRPVHLRKGQVLEVAKRVADKWVAIGLAKRVAAKSSPKGTTKKKTEGGN